MPGYIILNKIDKNRLNAEIVMFTSLFIVNFLGLILVAKLIISPWPEPWIFSCHVGLLS
jgi:hypothetical protein